MQNCGTPRTPVVLVIAWQYGTPDTAVFPGGTPFSTRVQSEVLLEKGFGLWLYLQAIPQYEAMYLSSI